MHWLKLSSTLPENRRINFRIGVHVGDVMVHVGDRTVVGGIAASYSAGEGWSDLCLRCDL